MNYRTIMKTITFIIPSTLQSSYLSPLLDFLIEIWIGEIIVIDNSKWETQINVENYKYTVTILQKNTWGVSFAKNQGALHATSDYLYFLDDDIFPLDPPCWQKALHRLLSQENDFVCIWGNIHIPPYFLIPHLYQKYAYFYGEKHIWMYDHFTKQYFWWANQIFQRKTFLAYWGFPESFGHHADKRGQNEEIFLQECLLQNQYKLFFKSWLDVIHYGVKEFSEEEFITRLKAQGKADYLLDKQINPHRLRTRTLKYQISLFFQKFISLNFYDSIRYKAYLAH